MNRLLVLGSVGPEVKRVQEALNRAIPPHPPRLPALSPTGRFDQATEERVKEFQRSNQLVVDGKVGEFTQATLFRTNFVYQRRRPPVVMQADQQCWAAALASWLGVTPGRPRLTKDQLLQRFAKFLKPSGALQSGPPASSVDILNPTRVRNEYLEQVFHAFQIDYEEVQGEKLRAEPIYSKLRHKGYVLLVYKIVTMNHTFVVYGVRVRAGMIPDLLVMDPWWIGGGYKDIPLWDLRNKGTIVYAWPR